MAKFKPDNGTGAGAGSHVNETVQVVRPGGRPSHGECRYSWNESLKCHEWIMNSAGGFSPHPRYKEQLDHQKKVMETERLLAQAQASYNTSTAEVDRLQRELAEALKSQANFSQLIKTLNNFKE